MARTVSRSATDELKVRTKNGIEHMPRWFIEGDTLPVDVPKVRRCRVYSVAAYESKRAAGYRRQANGVWITEDAAINAELDAEDAPT